MSMSELVILVVVAFILIKMVKSLVRSYIMRFVIFFVVGSGLFSHFANVNLFYNVLRVVNLTSMFHHLIH